MHLSKGLHEIIIDGIEKLDKHSRDCIARLYNSILPYHSDQTKDPFEYYKRWNTKQCTEFVMKFAATILLPVIGSDHPLFKIANILRQIYTLLWPPLSLEYQQRVQKELDILWPLLSITVTDDHFGINIHNYLQHILQCIKINGDRITNSTWIYESFYSIIRRSATGKTANKDLSVMKDLEQRKYVHHVMDTLQKGDITDNFAQLLIRLGAKINSNILSQTLQEKQKQRFTECIPLLFDQFIGGATIINLNSILDGCNNDPINADLSDALDDISPNGHQQRLKTSVQALYKVLNMEEWAPDAEHFFRVLRKLIKG
jgi:hypothetical protein